MNLFVHIVLKEGHVTTQTSVFQMRIFPFLNVFNLPDNFSENVSVSESKFKQVVFELFNFVY